MLNPLSATDDMSANLEIYESFEIEEESKSDSEEDIFNCDQDKDAVAHYWLKTIRSKSFLTTHDITFIKSTISRIIDPPPRV